MKKLFITLFALATTLFSISAQDNLDTIYLNNGSVVHGVITKHSPNQFIRLKNQNGETKVFLMSEISRINNQANTEGDTNVTNSSTMQVPTNTYEFSGPESNNQIEYRAFVDFGYSLGVGENHLDRMELSTSHGYLINSTFYFGLGTGLSYFTENNTNKVSVPIFANPRLIMPSNSFVSPFFDLKIGYAISDDFGGFYLSPSVGAKFNVNNSKKAINASVGYILQNHKISGYDGYDGYDGYYGRYEVESKTINYGAITFKLGLEF